MSKEEIIEALKSIKIRCHSKSMKYDPIDFDLDIVEKSLKALEIIKKHFIIKLEEETELNGNIWGRLVSIQAKEDKDTWDTTASANIVDYKEEFNLLKEVLE